MSDTSQAEMMKMLMDELKTLKENQGVSCRKRKEFSITSASIPVKVRDRGDSLRCYVNCSGDIESADDLVDLAIFLDEKGLEPEWWTDRDKSSSIRGRGNGNRNRY